MELLIELLRIADGKQNALSRNLGPDQWESLYECASAQAVLGVTFPALDLLPPSQRPPLRVYARWALMAENIGHSNQLMKGRIHDLSSRLAGKGLEFCLLKGSATALYYPVPSLRESGDLDIWVKGGTREVLSEIRHMTKVRNVCYHHCDASFFPDCKVEVHFRPSWMNSPIHNIRLQRYFKSVSDAQFYNFNRDLGISVPDNSFSTVFCIVHIFRHLLSEGVGLRQIMDCRYLLQSLDRAQRDEANSVLRSLGLGKFTAAVMWVLLSVFGIDESLLLCRPDKDGGRFLLGEIARSGNFGSSDKQTEKTLKAALPLRAVLKMRRMLRFIAFAPEEVICAPLFKTWQLFWRKTVNP